MCSAPSKDPSRGSGPQAAEGLGFRVSDFGRRLQIRVYSLSSVDSLGIASYGDELFLDLNMFMAGQVRLDYIVWFKSWTDT